MPADYKSIENRILNDVIPATETIDSIIHGAYYSIVRSEKLHYKEHAFDDSQKKRLANDIIEGLKEFTLEKNPHYKSIDPKLFDEIFKQHVLFDLFGIRVSDLENILMSMRRITKHEIAQLASQVSNAFYRRMLDNAFNEVKNPEDVKQGFEYLSQAYKNRGLNLPPDFNDISPKEPSLDVLKKRYLEYLNTQYQDKLNAKYG